MALRFEDMLERIGNASAAGVLDTLRLWQGGYIDRATLIEAVTDILELAMVQGTHYGQLSYAEVSALFKDEVPDYSGVLDTTADVGQSRDSLSGAIATVLDGAAVDHAMRLERLAVSVSTNSIQDSYADSLQGDPSATGWKRGLNMTACELCQYWHRSGRVWPLDHPMPTHTNCKCQQVPIFTDDIPKDTRLLQDRRHRRFIDSLSPDELEYYNWAKGVRDEYAKALRIGNKYVDIDSLPSPPRGVAVSIPPPNPKMTLRGLES